MHSPVEELRAGLELRAELWPSALPSSLAPGLLAFLWAV